MKKLYSVVIGAILSLSVPGIASAQFTVTDAIGGVPSVGAATLLNFDGALPSVLTLSGSAYLVTGGRGYPAYYSAPYFSGSTAAYFGESPANGFDASQYVAVESGGSATFTFSTPQVYFGLFWGSFDPGANVISFYDSADNLIGQVTPAQVTGVTYADNTDANGSAYVNIVSSVPFSSVTMTTSGAPGAESFEFDDVAYAAVAPEPSSFALLGTGLSVLGLVWRRRTA